MARQQKIQPVFDPRRSKKTDRPGVSFFIKFYSLILVLHIVYPTRTLAQQASFVSVDSGRSPASLAWRAAMSYRGSLCLLGEATPYSS